MYNKYPTSQPRMIRQEIRLFSQMLLISAGTVYTLAYMLFFM